MKPLVFIVFVCLWTNLRHGQEEDLKKKFLTDSLSIIQKRVEKTIIPSRYMAQTLISITDTIRDWENVNVSLYRYSVDKGRKIGLVYMANADAKKLATWIITTCYVVTQNLNKKNTDFLIKSIKNASGGQFPVKGIVYEDMNGDGYYPYIFKDGITVFLNSATRDDLTLITDINIKKTGKYARIISTTRQQYNAMFPLKRTLGKEWLNVVREEYKLALTSDTNNLLIAWAKGKIK